MPRPNWLQSNLLVTCFCITIPQANAQETGHTHDGFFLRMAVGGCFAKDIVKDREGNELATQGGGALWDLTIGHTVAKNLILHGDIFGAALVEPDSYENGSKQGQLPGRYAMNAAGGGITWYLSSRSNVFFNASVGLAILKARIGIFEFQTEAGFAGRFMLGKEWWVSDNWGIGITGTFIYSTVPSEFDEPHHTFVGGLMFSATYN